SSGSGSSPGCAPRVVSACSTPPGSRRREIPVSPDVTALGRDDDWSGVRAVVAGFGVSGFAAADNLTHLGASVTALDESDAGDRPDKAELLEVLGATVRLGVGTTARLPDDVDLVVTSPGWKPDAPL